MRAKSIQPDDKPRVAMPVAQEAGRQHGEMFVFACEFKRARVGSRVVMKSCPPAMYRREAEARQREEAFSS